MRFTKLFPESDPELVQEVQQQYMEQASILRSMGFVPVATVAERVFPFSLLLVIFSIYLRTAR